MWIEKLLKFTQALEVVISAWGWNYGFFLFSFISEFSKVSKVSILVFNEKTLFKIWSFYFVLIFGIIASHLCLKHVHIYS